MRESHLPDARPAFIGFRMKRVVSAPEWLLSAGGAAMRVAQICSVSDCISEPPPNWMDRWDFNSACCYNSEATALATVPAGEANSYELFAYRIFPVRYDTDGPHSIDPYAEWGWNEEPFPREQGLETYAAIGYDIAGGGIMNSVQRILGFGCSPLSCNRLASEHDVNRYCLLATLPEATSAASRFAIPNEAEPGPYYVYEVLRRRSELWAPDEISQ